MRILIIFLLLLQSSQVLAVSSSQAIADDFNRLQQSIDQLNRDNAALLQKIDLLSKKVEALELKSLGLPVPTDSASGTTSSSSPSSPPKQQFIEIADGVLVSPLPEKVIQPTLSLSGVVFSGTITQKDIMRRILLQKETLLEDVGFPTNYEIGMFEFIQPNGVFVSFDSGTNPPGVSAFRLKIAYKYQLGRLTRLGVFEYEFDQGRYRTLSGTNPYTNSQRIKIPNPLYKGKLIDIPSFVPASTPSVTPPVVSAPVIQTPTKPVVQVPVQTPQTSNTPQSTPSNQTILTLKEIQSLRTTKFNYVAALEAARIASAANPENLEFRKEIYINLFMLTRTQEALDEIEKLEKIVSPLPKSYACDAVMIARNAKNKVLETKYTPICKQ